MLKTIVYIIVSYLVGSISIAYYMCRKFYSIDIRQYGSGNPGSTNVLRVLGTKPALIVFLADLLKGFITVSIGRLIGGENLALLAAIAVVVGHDWSIFLNFKGGKGIATSLGVVIGIFPKVAPILAIFGISVIFISRYVSLGSISTATLLPILLLIFRYPAKHIIVGLILGAIAVYRHRDNIERMLAGKENKLGQKVRR
ncbi:MAG TPA: glycerol-3-phosphate 1-O-acyltransferase PlsY [Thermoanaerobacterales bacterium]|nr:glycerol-3-phosphate 1-O-acyltransferase PlsY [Thermoanaerobacterales bacterium]